MIKKNNKFVQLLKISNQYVLKNCMCCKTNIQNKWSNKKKLITKTYIIDFKIFSF